MYNPRRRWLGRIYKFFYRFCLDSRAIRYFICHSSTERNLSERIWRGQKDSIIFLKLGTGKAIPYQVILSPEWSDISFQEDRATEITEPLSRPLMDWRNVLLLPVIHRM
jgi:hypothetical protein